MEWHLATQENYLQNRWLQSCMYFENFPKTYLNLIYTLCTDWCGNIYYNVNLRSEQFMAWPMSFLREHSSLFCIFVEYYNYVGLQFFGPIAYWRNFMTSKMTLKKSYICGSWSEPPANEQLLPFYNNNVYQPSYIYTILKAIFAESVN